MEKQKITIYTIANEAGVSTATVSRVIAGNYPVSEKTKEKVNRIIEKYDFHPNAIARSLSNKKSKILGFITPAITNLFFSQVFIEVEKHALNKGYLVLLGNTLHDRKLESKYMQMLLDQQAEGIILLGGLINDTNPHEEYIQNLLKVKKQTKLVMINGSVPGVDSFSVSTDESKGINLLVNHLVKQGHRKIGIIGGLESITTTEVKIEAFKDALRENNLVFNKDWQFYTGFDIESGETGLKELIHSNIELPTALIGINDMVASGLVKENKKHPFKFVLSGFDNTDLSRLSFPELTTVSHPYNELGKIAVDMMDDRYRRNGRKKVVLDPYLIERESTFKQLI